MTVRPQLWVIAGPNGAGKTTLVTRRIGYRIPVINPDEIARGLPLRHSRPDERRAGELAIRRRVQLLGAGADFAIETTLTGNSSMRFLIGAARVGYKTTLVFVGLRDVELSLQRVADRVRQGGHAVPVSAIVRRFPQVLAKLPSAMALADRSYLLDNSGDRRRLLMAREGDRVRFLAQDLPRWFVDALSAHEGFRLRSGRRGG